MNTLLLNLDNFLQGFNVNDSMFLRDIHYKYCKFLLKNKKISLQQYVLLFPLITYPEDFEFFKCLHVIDDKDVGIPELLRDIYSFKYPKILSLDSDLKPTYRKSLGIFIS
jgi:hypothetical protein